MPSHVSRKGDGSFVAIMSNRGTPFADLMVTMFLPFDPGWCFHLHRYNVPEGYSCTRERSLPKCNSVRGGGWQQRVTTRNRYTGTSKVRRRQPNIARFCKNVNQHTGTYDLFQVFDNNNTWDTSTNGENFALRQLLPMCPIPWLLVLSSLPN